MITVQGGADSTRTGLTVTFTLTAGMAGLSSKVVSLKTWSLILLPDSASGLQTGLFRADALSRYTLIKIIQLAIWIITWLWHIKTVVEVKAARGSSTCLLTGGPTKV